MHLLAFPEDRILYPTQAGARRPLDSLAATDAVIVTHQGMSKVYDCPQDLHAAVLVACAPELRATERRRTRHRIRRHAAAVRRLSARRWKTVNRWLEACAVAGAAAAIVAWGFGL